MNAHSWWYSRSDHSKQLVRGGSVQAQSVEPPAQPYSLLAPLFFKNSIIEQVTRQITSSQGTSSRRYGSQQAVPRSSACVKGAIDPRGRAEAATAQGAHRPPTAADRPRRAPPPPAAYPQLSEAHEEVLNALLAPIRQAWREVQQDSPLTALMAFFHAVDWKARAGPARALAVRGWNPWGASGAGEGRRGGPRGDARKVSTPRSESKKLHLRPAGARAAGAVAGRPAGGAGGAVCVGGGDAAQPGVPLGGVLLRRWGGRGGRLGQPCGWGGAGVADTSGIGQPSRAALSTTN
jgi:hypothetical protein